MKRKNHFSNKTIKYILCLLIIISVGIAASGCNFGVVSNDKAASEYQTVSAEEEYTENSQPAQEEASSVENSEDETAESKTSANSSGSRDTTAAKAGKITSGTDSKKKTTENTTKSKKTTEKSSKKSNKKKNNKTKKSGDKNSVSGSAKASKSGGKNSNSGNSSSQSNEKNQNNGKDTASQDNSDSSVQYCSISITYSVINSNNPYILSNYKCKINDGDSVYSVLKRSCEDNNIPIGASKTTYGIYVYSINNINEDYFGKKRGGWMYKQNGKVPMKACDKQTVGSNDEIEFYYVKVS